MSIALFALFILVLQVAEVVGEVEVECSAAEEELRILVEIVALGHGSSLSGVQQVSYSEGSGELLVQETLA